MMPSSTLPSYINNNDSLLDIIRLIRSENVGAVTFHKLITKYGSAAKALDAIPHLTTRAGSKRSISVYPADKAQMEIEKTQQSGASFISYNHAQYPELLKHVPDAPPLLIAHGKTELLTHKNIIAIVGSRNASANGRKYAQKLANELGEAGFYVVSGLARGIDRYAHQGALEHGTIGVIAGGINHIYPPENKDMFAIMKERGVVMTEAPFGAAPQHRHFPARNRIIAGMSQGTVIVEAAKKSGSLITAKYALDYNREVCAVPGSPMDPRSEGGNHLIQQGATLVSHVDDIIHACRDAQMQIPPTSEQYLFDTQAEIDENNLDSERQAVAVLIDATPVTIEDIIIMSGVDARIVNVILLEMELAGMLRRHQGGTISRNFEEE